MPELIIEAPTLDVAHGLYRALAEFYPELGGDARNGYRITLEMGSERALVGALDGIQEYVSTRDEGPARVDLDGRRYTFHVQ
ncbi:MAG TPA: hypothetical protein VJT84_08405 [Gaiellaceae bacterium]|nr:hypothetical protein [Gaiellaceae bacterium]